MSGHLKSHFRTMLALGAQLVDLNKFLYRIAVFDAAELLQKSDNSVADLCQSHLLTQAKSGPTSKGQVTPRPMVQGVPPFRPIFVRIPPENVGAAMQGVQAYGYSVSFPDENRAVMREPASNW